MPLRDLTRVKGRDQIDGEIVRRSAVNAVRDSERKVMRAWDEERLHDIFHEAVVLDGAAALDFQQGPVAVIAGVDRVRVDAVERLSVLAIQERDPREPISGLDVPAA